MRGEQSSTIQKNRRGQGVRERQPLAQRKGSPIVWAIDSTRLESFQIQKTRKVLEYWIKGKQDILPVSIFSPFDLGLIMPSNRKLKAETMKEVEGRVKEKWEEQSISGESANFLVAESNSLRDRAQALVDFARRKKAEIIVTGSGAKSRMNLIGIGSFAETLISISPIPVLVIGENVTTITPFTRILFPTDFSDASKQTFRTVVKFAKKHKSEVLLYHYLDLESGPLAFGISWGYEVRWIEEFWEEQEEQKRLLGAKWKEWAKKQGIKCSFICDRSIGGLGNRILETSRENQANLLSISVTRGPLSQVILGHTIRGIFAHSHCPALVIHSKSKQGRLHS